MEVAVHPEAEAVAIRSVASQGATHLEVSLVVAMVVAEATDRNQDQLAKKGII